jgi:hypothetical protein
MMSALWEYSEGRRGRNNYAVERVGGREVSILIVGGSGVQCRAAVSARQLDDARRPPQHGRDAQALFASLTKAAPMGPSG